MPVSMTKCFLSVVLFAVAILCVLSGCKKQPKKIIQFCARQPKVKIRGRFPALNPNYKLQWTEIKSLKVYFIEGDTVLHDKIISIINEWTTSTRIKFERTKKITQSQIRVTFRSGGYSSAVGLECIQKEYENQPTTFLEGLDTLTDKREFKRVVLHEFGHALGLEHELQKTSVRIPWNTAAVYKYYADHYHWDTTAVNKNIFLQFKAPKEYEEFDSSSIMMYAVPDTLTIGNYFIPWPDDLSPSDRLYIKKWYHN